jgi:putative ABC transport system permease protein
MKIGQQFLEALESLASNKLRSALTMLGIVIGVAAVISMLAIGAGAQASISGSINSIGTNLIFIFPNTENITHPQPLTMSDAAALADPAQAPSIQSVAPVIQGRGLAAFGDQSTNTSLVAVTPAYANVRNLITSEGDFITDNSMTGRSPVAVLGSQTAQNLFGRTNQVVGETIRLNGQPFRVIGVLESKGGSSFGSEDDQILVPLTTGQSRLMPKANRDQVDQIMVQALSPNLVAQAGDEATAILQLRHRTVAGVEDFRILKQQDILNTAQSILGVFTIFLGGIGAISLLVGGIGIMNIMLVSVTERTREIGLRKALGARKRDILSQFLIESAALSLLGGVVGILLAWGISALIGQIAAANNTPINPVIGLNSVLLATLFSAAVGLFFGIYPANRAARLEPVEALRSE